MFFNKWVVLLVDDEPDVLQMSKLVMKKFEVFGLPVKIYTADSKAAALSLINDNFDVASNLAVAFVDVVMETDSAGLELCEHIRKDLGNQLSQLYIRTGQAGLFNESDVIDKYDINGFFTKVETTQGKLYSLVKSSIRQYLSFGMSLSAINLLNGLIYAEDRDMILEVVRDLGGYNIGLEDIPRWLFIDDNVLFEDEVDAAKGQTIRDELMALDGVNLHPGGDKYVVGKDGFQMIHITEKPGQAATTYLFKTQFQPPEFIVKTMHNVIVSIGRSWQKAG